MDDNQIIELFNARNENAIREAQSKYEKYLYKIAYNILGSNEDSAECVNDTYYKVWETIPPHKPLRLAAYMAAITRNLAITVFRRNNTASRAPSQYALSLDELAECVSGEDPAAGDPDSGEISRCISAYLRTVSKQARIIFVCRYYFNDSVSDIAAYLGAGESKVKSSLFRTRKGLREYLTKEGIDI